MPEEPSLDERIARQLVEDDDRIAREIARGYGRPPNAAKASDARELELWLETDPTFDEYAAWAEHASRGTDPWVAKTEIALKKYPNRLRLMQAGRPKVKDQIDFANRLGERAERELARRRAEALTTPLPAPLPAPLPSPPAPAPLAERAPAMPAPPLLPTTGPPPAPSSDPAVDLGLRQGLPSVKPMALPGVTRGYETEPPY